MRRRRAGTREGELDEEKENRRRSRTGGGEIEQEEEK